MSRRGVGRGQPAAAIDPTMGRTPSWTASDVLLWMKRAWGTNAKTRNPGEARPLSWPTDYLSQQDPLFDRKCTIILAWARCRAQGASFDLLCRERGWPPSTAYRLRDEAAAEIARGINEAIAHARRTGPT